MICRPFQVALLVGALVAGMACSARADQQETKKPEVVPVPPPASGTPHHPSEAGAPAHNPCMRTITVVECVPETYTTKRIAYKRVCKEEKYTAYKCVTEPVTKKRIVTVYERRQVVKDVTTTVYDRVPVVEERTVMRPQWTTQQVTEMRTRRVDRGSYVTEEVEAPLRTFAERARWRLFADKCCEPCPPCPATRCVKRWCSNWVTECYPVTVCKKVCVMRPEVVKHCTYKCVPRVVTKKVCTTECVPVQREECYTECITRRIPYEATRTVVTCVPYEETVTCTRYVRRCVQRQVPVEPCCDPCDPCGDPCCDPCGGRQGLFGRLRGLFSRRGDCCETSCGDCCTPCGGHSSGCCH